MSTTATEQTTTERLPVEWRDLMAAQLDAQVAEVAVPTSYYDGDHPLQFATAKFREAFGAQFSAFADNWCEIVVDAAVERLEIVGFRFGENADEDAWAIWQANSLDLESVVAHQEAGIAGRCYLLVDPNDADPAPDALPLITVESPQQMIVVTDPANRRRRLAALKRWTDDTGIMFANVYLPDMIVKWQTLEPVREGVQPEWQEIPGGPNPLLVVPAVPLENKPRLMRNGESDLKPAMPIQNAINKLCTDMIVASEYGAFRQRAVTGIEVPRDPETGEPIGKPQIEAAMSRLWTLENPDSKVVDLAQTDLKNFSDAIGMFVQHMAAQTRTPPHYLLGQITNASGDALKSAEVGLVSKCRRKIRGFSDGWEEAMALALLATGRTDVTSAQCEALWSDPEQVNVTQLTDSAIKKQTVGVPREVIWLELGYTPDQIKDMTVLADAEQAAKDARAAQFMQAKPTTDQTGAQNQPGTTTPATTTGG